MPRRMARDRSSPCGRSWPGRWNRRLDRLHPFLHLALLDLGLASRCSGLEDVFLRGSLEVLGHRLLETLFVLPDHAGHAVELIDTPFVRTRDARCEQRLLRIEDILELVHGGFYGHLTKRSL